MSEAELLKRIEALERRVEELEHRPVDAVSTHIEPRHTRIVGGPR